MRAPTHVVRACTVTGNEFEDSAPGEFMHRAATGIVNRKFIYDQMVSYNHEACTVMIHAREGKHVCNRTSVKEIAPVVAFAISSSTIRVDDVALDTLDDLHHAILD